MLIFGCLTSVLLTLPFLRTANAEKLPVQRNAPTDCFYTCTNLGDLTWSDVPANTTYFGKFGLSQLFITSFECCLGTFCQNQGDVDQQWVVYQGTAAELGSTMPSRSSVQASLPPNPVVADVWTNKLVVYNETIVPSAFAYQKYFRTLDTMDQAIYYGQSFGYAIYILLVLIIGTGLLRRLIATMYRHTGNGDRSEVSPSDSVWSRLRTTYTKHLGTPALLGYSHATPAFDYFSIPTRLQGLVIFVYVALNVTFCAVGYETFDDNTYYPDDRSDQVWRYISDRSGIISFWNLPLLWLFAGRNDIFLWVTGWSYSTMNLMHRWVARVTTLEAIVHSIGYTVLYRKTLAYYWAEMWWRTGVFATVLMALALSLAMLPIRKHWYEVFLVVHICIAAATIPLLWYHVDTEMAGQYNPFLFACIAIWAFDRGVRLVRLQIFSYKVFTSKNAVAVMTPGEPEVIRLTFDTPFKISPKPGQYYFIYNPCSIVPWQNHPFTLASWEQTEASTRLNFLIGVRRGATRRLRSKVGDGPAPLKVMIEGPYGHSQSLERFDHVVFVVGGSGITAVLPYIKVLAARGLTRSITLIWSVKNNAYASSVLSHELADAPINIVLHITEEEQRAISVLTAGKEDILGATKKVQSEDNNTSTPSVSIVYGRPRMEDLARSSVRRLVGSEFLAIMACGPAKMSDDMRKAASDLYGTGEGKVSASTFQYFEERFGW